ncbi:MAG: hypothetical protein WAT91_05400, partial [Saprospiraceae bacterium]
YVIQDNTGHTHKSEILTTNTPTYSYTTEPQVSVVMEWAANKRKELKKDEELIVLSMYKL